MTDDGFVFLGGSGGTSLVVREARRVSGDFTVTDTVGVWTLIASTTVSLPATVGDYVALQPPTLMRSATSTFHLDLVVAVSGAIVRAASTNTATPATEGHPGLYHTPASFRTVAGPFGFVVTSGDRDTGNVIFQVAYKSTAAAGTVYRSATYPLILTAHNYGPVNFA